MKGTSKGGTLGRTALLMLALIGIALTAAIPARAFGFPNITLATGVVLPRYSAIAENGILVSASPITSEGPNGFTQARVTVMLRTEADTIYAGTESAGLFRSSDDGATWVPLTDEMGVPMPNLTVTALAEGDSSNTIYAAVGYWLGTSEAHFAPLGIYASEDGGMSWQAMTGGIPHDSIVAIGIDAEHPSIVHATTEGNEDIPYVL